MNVSLVQKFANHIYDNKGKLVCSLACAIGILLNLDCWTREDDVRGVGGTPHNFSRLADCQSACIYSDSCVAIDWERSDNTKATCWILTLPDTIPITTPEFLTHYVLTAACRGEFYFYRMLSACRVPI